LGRVDRVVFNNWILHPLTIAPREEMQMSTRNLPLNTWMVVEQRSAWKQLILVSQHDTQGAAEAERDRRNRASLDRPFRACLLVEPVAQRMGGRLAPAVRTRQSSKAATQRRAVRRSTA